MSTFWPMGLTDKAKDALGAFADLARKMSKFRHGMYAICDSSGETQVLINLSNLDQVELNRFASQISLYYTNRAEPKVLKFDSPETAQRIMSGISRTFESTK